MELGFAGKAVFVGGASRGIGLAIARAFAAEGARVVITARNVGPLEDACSVIAAERGRDAVLGIPADMSIGSEIERAFDEAEAAFGPVETVIANVGNGTAQSGYDIGRVEWDRVLTENLLSSVLLAAEALKRLTARGRGCLTFITSIAGIEAIGAPVTYSAAKSALQMAVKLYARQVGPLGVRVNAVAPGNVLFPGGAWEAKLAERRSFFEEYVRNEVALQRFANPQEIADVTVFLASERAKFVTGAIWVVDGGQTRSY